MFSFSRPYLTYFDFANGGCAKGRVDLCSHKEKLVRVNGTALSFTSIQSRQTKNCQLLIVNCQYIVTIKSTIQKPPSLLCPHPRTPPIHYNRSAIKDSIKYVSVYFSARGPFDAFTNSISCSKRSNNTLRSAPSDPEVLHKRPVLRVTTLHSRGDHSSRQPFIRTTPCKGISPTGRQLRARTMLQRL